MGKKVRISDESVNCYGTRIITSGIDLTQYERNPVLLYMHDRSQGVVGLVKNLKVENGELTGKVQTISHKPKAQKPADSNGNAADKGCGTDLKAQAKKDPQ